MLMNELLEGAIYMHAGIFLSACVITVGVLVALETLAV